MNIGLWLALLNYRVFRPITLSNCQRKLKAMAGRTWFRVPTAGPSFLSKSTCILNKVRRQSITFIPLLYFGSLFFTMHRLSTSKSQNSNHLSFSNSSNSKQLLSIGYTSVQEAPRGGTILLYPNCARQALSFRHFGIGSWGIVWFLSTNHLLIRNLKNLLEVILIYFESKQK